MSNENDQNVSGSDGLEDSASLAESQTSSKAQATAAHVAQTTEVNEPSNVGEPQQPTPSRVLHWKLEFCFLCVMLIIAMAGMAVTQASTNGAWEYWLFAVLGFAGIGMYRDFKWARQTHASVWKTMVKQLVHWAVLLLMMKALFWMEQYNAISREAASIAALFLLATTSIHAGLHFHWTFAIVGVVMAAMSVVLGVLEQSMLLSWFIVLPLAIGGAFLFYMKARKASHHG